MSGESVGCTNDGTLRVHRGRIGLPVVKTRDQVGRPIQVALLPFSVVIGAASRLAGRMTERVGPRWPLTVGPIVTGVGFALLTRLDPTADYWTGVLPRMAVVALGMAGAIAPRTTAVLSSVDEPHTGTASGFNSAIARTGGLVATALGGGVVATSGIALTVSFQAAAGIAAAAAVAAGVVAFFTLASDGVATHNATRPMVRQSDHTVASGRERGYRGKPLALRPERPADHVPQGLRAFA